MRYIYEFELYKSESTYVATPYDFEGGTFGVDIPDTAESAADWLIETVNDYMLSGRPLPKATFGNTPSHRGENLLVSIDTSLDVIDTMPAHEAAVKLGVSKGRVSQLIKEGLLDGYRKGHSMFVTTSSVEARLFDKPKAGRPKKNKSDQCNLAATPTPQGVSSPR